MVTSTSPRDPASDGRAASPARTPRSQPRGLDDSANDSSFIGTEDATPVGVRFTRKEALDDTISDLNGRPSGRTALLEENRGNADADDNVDTSAKSTEPCGIILQR